MGYGMTKAERLREMERLYFQRAYSDSEMAERLQVDRTTVFRDRRELETSVPFIEVEKGCWKIDRTKYLSEIRINLNEALSLYLAARRISQQTRTAQPHTASALEKLAICLKQPMTTRIVKSADVILSQNIQPERIKLLETIAQSWVEGIKLRIQYRGLQSQRSLNYVISPYLIEPSPWSDSTYVIGHSDVHGDIGVFKIDRIEQANLTTERFIIPEDFDEETLMKYAWGIWYTEKEPERVILRFSPGIATHRLKESIWHPTQEITDLEDGGCLWSAMVAEWQEMLPWIKGWGAEVEVIQPSSLKNLLIREARRLAKIYQIDISENVPPYFNLWAKLEKSQIPSIHPLIYHMLDVGECALALWNYALSEQTKQLFTKLLSLDSETAGRQLAFWASLHDTGKAAPGFQRKFPEIVPKLKEIGLNFSEETINPAPHGIVTAWALKDLLVQETSLSPRDANCIAFALGGHHGAWPTNSSILSPALKSSDKGGPEWKTIRIEIIHSLKDVYHPEIAISLPKKIDELNTFLTLFSGLVSVADWIGSMSNNFPFMDDYLPPEKYAKDHTADQAKYSLDNLGWIGWQAKGEILDFSSMFPAYTPNPIQEEVIDQSLNIDLPALVILEAPTGIGKTEAALFLADTWLQHQKGHGLYIAMPTQATSNQMYSRVISFLKSRYPVDAINAHLVHGASFLDQQEDTPTPQGIAQDDATTESNVKAETWFLPRKRTLLAPFGVGTVDQALMSVLQTNHFFVRMFGLGQKIVIFDEIHAYDIYMSTLFQHLLRWLRSINTSVILLSATLPNKTRQELVDAWSGEKSGPVSISEYPRLTIANENSLLSIPLPKTQNRTFNINWIDPNPEQIAIHLKENLKHGGCAAIVCNRVKRAQEIYEAIKSAQLVDNDNLILFHARFPFQWRDDIEKRVLNIFGKNQDAPHQINSSRPLKAIVVATQVIEQSLDLDFDYIITDLAPIDLLIQRAGRLHRHQQNDPIRSTSFQSPSMAIVKSEMKDELPNFGPDIRIYDKATLLSTWHVLQGRDHLALPDETSALIEAVYGELPDQDELDPKFLQSFHEAQEKARLENESDIHNAKQRLVGSPDDEYLLTERNEGLEEDNPQIHDAFRALTRLAEPSVSLVCLYETEKGIALDPYGLGAPINFKKRPNIKEAKELLKLAVNVQRRDVVKYFINNVRTSSDWRKSAAVRYHYPVVFDQNGEYHPEGADFTLKLSRELGLEVIKEDK